jgi:hypothetical protein
MKLLIILIISLNLFINAHATSLSEETPVKHMKVADVTSLEEAKLVFTEKSAELKSKKVLDIAELQQIHVNTYTLEKSIEYFGLNLDGEKQAISKKLAGIVENIHINSENNRKEQTKKYLNEYFELADKLASKF